MAKSMAGRDTVALLFLGRSKCSICDKVISEGDEYVLFAQFIADKSDPLWQYSDSSMRSVCFSTWEHREEFASRHRAAVGRMPGR